MRVKIIKNHDLVVRESSKGRPLSVAAFKKSDEPITTKREWGERLIAAGVAEEVDSPAKRPDNPPQVIKALRKAVGAEND